MLLAACAGPRIDAQWSDPALGDTRPLAGAKVLLLCQAPEVVLARLCTDRLRAEALQRGLQVIDRRWSDADARTDPGGSDARLVERARSAQVAALWVVTVARAATTAHGGGPDFSVGMGGTGHRGGVGVSVGVPIGGGWSTREGYAADTRVILVEGARLLWTARARVDGGGSTEQQIADLVQRLADAAGQARVL